QGDGLDEALDVWVGALVGPQPQPAGGDGVLLGEAARELAEELQLALVVVVQGGAHASLGLTEERSAGSSRMVSNGTSGAGSRHRRASTRKRSVWAPCASAARGVARTSRSRGSNRAMTAMRTRPRSSRCCGVSAGSGVRSGRP